MTSIIHDSRDIIVIIDHVDTETQKFYSTKVSRFGSISDAVYFCKSFCEDCYDYTVKIAQIVSEYTKDDPE